MQQTINERLKILIDALKISARAFSVQLQVPESNTRNYLDKTTKLNSDYLERIKRNFKSVNLSWLITGEGEPFLPETDAQSEHFVAFTKNNYGNNVGNNHGKVSQQTNMLPLSAEQHQALHREIELLRSQLADKERIIKLLEKQLPSN